MSLLTKIFWYVYSLFSVDVDIQLDNTNKICNTERWSIITGNWNYLSNTCNFEITDPEKENIVWFGSQNGDIANQVFDSDTFVFETIFELKHTGDSQSSEGHVGFLFRTHQVEKENYATYTLGYELELSAARDFIKINRHDANGITNLINNQLPAIDFNRVYNLTIVASNSTSYTVFLEHENVLSIDLPRLYTENSDEQGTIGLVGHEKSVITFKSIEWRPNLIKGEIHAEATAEVRRRHHRHGDYIRSHVEWYVNHYRHEIQEAREQILNNTHCTGVKEIFLFPTFISNLRREISDLWNDFEDVQVMATIFGDRFAGINTVNDLQSFDDEVKLTADGSANSRRLSDERGPHTGQINSDSIPERHRGSISVNRAKISNMLRYIYKRSEQFYSECLVDPTTFAPTSAPTSAPSVAPTNNPSKVPTAAPSKSPTKSPTPAPTGQPTPAPTAAPSAAPTAAPTHAPSNVPSDVPSTVPSSVPSPAPTGIPSNNPSTAPSDEPTQAPTKAPSNGPSVAPSTEPTPAPSDAPSSAPSTAPTPAPSNEPSSAPSKTPSGEPTPSPSNAPSIGPSNAPSAGPTPAPSNGPSNAPSKAPSAEPTPSPTNSPSSAPSSAPTPAPTDNPTNNPSASPTHEPTPAPTKNIIIIAVNNARFTNDGSAIAFKFTTDSTGADVLVRSRDNSLNAAELCYKLFVNSDSSFYDQELGGFGESDTSNNNVQCRFGTNSLQIAGESFDQSYLLVYLNTQSQIVSGVNATIFPANYLTGTGNGVTTEFAFAQNQYDLTVSPPNNPVSPTAVVTGSTDVGACDDIVISGVLSAFSGPQPVSITFTSSSFTNNEISSYLSNDGQVLTVPAADANAGTSYTFEMTATSAFGTTDSASITVQVNTAPLPIVSIEAPLSWSRTITLSAKASVSIDLSEECLLALGLDPANASDPVPLTYDWSITPLNQIENSDDNILINEALFQVVRFSTQPLTTYTITVVTDPGDNLIGLLPVTKSINVDITKSGLTCRLDGGGRTINFADELILSSSSIDNDFPTSNDQSQFISYSWTCQQQIDDEDFGLAFVDCSNDINNEFSTQINDESITLPGATLQSDSTYKFLLNIQSKLDASVSSQCETLIQTSGQSQIDVQLQSSTTEVAQRTRLTLTTNTPDISSDFPAQTEGIDYEFRYRWSAWAFTAPVSNIFEITDAETTANFNENLVDLSQGGVINTAVTSRNLVTSGANLVPGRFYVFSLAVTAESLTSVGTILAFGSAAVQIETKIPPSIRNIIVPETSIFLVDDISIAVQSNVESGAEYTFSYYTLGTDITFIPDTNDYSLITVTSSSQINGVLLPIGNNSIEVCLSDQFGGVTCETQVTEVTENIDEAVEQDTCDLKGLVSDLIDVAVASKDSQKIISLITLPVEMTNDPENVFVDNATCTSDIINQALDTTEDFINGDSVCIFQNQLLQSLRTLLDSELVSNDVASATRIQTMVETVVRRCITAVNTNDASASVQEAQEQAQEINDILNQLINGANNRRRRRRLQTSNATDEDCAAITFAIQTKDTLFASLLNASDLLTGEQVSVDGESFGAQAANVLVNDLTSTLSSTANGIQVTFPRQCNDNQTSTDSSKTVVQLTTINSDVAVDCWEKLFGQTGEFSVSTTNLTTVTRTGIYSVETNETFENCDNTVDITINSDSFLVSDEEAAAQFDESITSTELVCEWLYEPNTTWLTDGCDTIVSDDETSVTCECNHLTAFRVTEFEKIPTRAPTNAPTVVPTDAPTSRPTASPTNDPTSAPTHNPTSGPTASPTNDPTPAPTHNPTSGPTHEPTPDPTSSPTNFPTRTPSNEPTPAPTSLPTPAPTDVPTSAPTTPTKSPTSQPSRVPTDAPTATPTAPTLNPSNAPTGVPTVPTAGPSRAPTPPTSSPSYAPTGAPTSPTSVPTMSPTNKPTSSPSMTPSSAPSSTPTIGPSDSPSSAPTPAPSDTPSSAPSASPSSSPTPAPSDTPSSAPSDSPSSSPTPAPSDAPSSAPSTAPSPAPSNAPSSSPSFAPSTSPSKAPTSGPTAAPTSAPVELSSVPLLVNFDAADEESDEATIILTLNPVFVDEIDFNNISISVEGEEQNATIQSSRRLLVANLDFTVIVDVDNAQIELTFVNQTQLVDFVADNDDLDITIDFNEQAIDSITFSIDAPLLTNLQSLPSIGNIDADSLDNILIDETNTFDIALTFEQAIILQSISDSDTILVRMVCKTGESDFTMCDYSQVGFHAPSLCESNDSIISNCASANGDILSKLKFDLDSLNSTLAPTITLVAAEGYFAPATKHTIQLSVISEVSLWQANKNFDFNILNYPQFSASKTWEEDSEVIEIEEATALSFNIHSIDYIGHFANELIAGSSQSSLFDFVDVACTHNDTTNLAINDTNLENCGERIEIVSVTDSANFTVTFNFEKNYFVENVHYFFTFIITNPNGLESEATVSISTFNVAPESEDESSDDDDDFFVSAGGVAVVLVIILCGSIIIGGIIFKLQKHNQKKTSVENSLVHRSGPQPVMILQPPQQNLVAMQPVQAVPTMNGQVGIAVVSQPIPHHVYPEQGQFNMA